MAAEVEQAEMVPEEPVARVVQVGEAEEAIFMSTISGAHQILAEFRTLRTFLVV